MNRSDVITQTWESRPTSAYAWDFRCSGALKVDIPASVKEALADAHPDYQPPEGIEFSLWHDGLVYGRLDSVIISVAKPQAEITDRFEGDNAALVQSAKVLLDLDADGALAPHGIGNHARTIIEAFICRTVVTDITRDPQAR